MALQKITEVQVISSLESSDNPTLYVETDGAFRRVTYAQIRALILEGLLAEFDSTANYAAGEYCLYQGTAYVFTDDHAAGAWTGTDAAQAVIGNDIAGTKTAMDGLGLSIVDGALCATYNE